jgi:hypothetical protein
VLRVTAFSQNDPLSLLCVVYWASQDASTGWIKIKEDGLSGKMISGNVNTKGWEKKKDGSITKRPVGYVSGTTPRISACFHLPKAVKPECPVKDAPSESPVTSLVPYFVRGTVLDQNGQPTDMVLKPKQLYKTSEKKIYEYWAEPCSQAFEPRKVQYYEQFRIKWEWSSTGDENSTWHDSGISDNRLYVTHKTPIGEGPFFYTCLHLGCAEANNQTLELEVVSKIYARFATKCVKRVDDNDCLKYWGSPLWTRQNVGLEYLLQNASGDQYEDARCGTWEEFMHNVMDLQGLNGKKITALPYNPAGVVGVINDNSDEDPLYKLFLSKVEDFFGNDIFPKPNDPVNPANVYIDDVDPDNNQPGSGERIILHGKRVMYQGKEKMLIAAQFFVKNWDFSAGEQNFYAISPSGSTPLKIKVKKPDGGVVEKSIFGADMGGVKAQETENPRAHFDDHVLYQYNNKYYDPSYGSGPFQDKDSWVVESLAGYGTLLTYIDKEDFRFRLIWVHQIASASNANTIKFK